MRITRSWRGWVAQLELAEPAGASAAAKGATQPTQWIRAEHIVMAIGGFHEPR